MRDWRKFVSINRLYVQTKCEIATVRQEGRDFNATDVVEMERPVSRNETSVKELQLQFD